MQKDYMELGLILVLKYFSGYYFNFLWKLAKTTFLKCQFYHPTLKSDIFTTLVKFENGKKIKENFEK